MFIKNSLANSNHFLCPFIEVVNIHESKFLIIPVIIENIICFTIMFLPPLPAIPERKSALRT